MYTSSDEERSSSSSLLQPRISKRVKAQPKVQKNVKRQDVSHSSTTNPSSTCPMDDGFLRPKKTARPKPEQPFVLPTSNRMESLGDSPREPVNTSVTPSTARKPPPIYIDHPPSESNSCAIRKWLSGLKVSASFRRFNDKQYILFPHDDLATRTLQTHFTQLAIPYYTHAPRHVKKHGQYLILGLDINQPTITEIQEALSEVPDIINIRHMSKSDKDGNKHPINPVVITTLPTTTLAHFKHITDICYYRVRIVKYTPTTTVSQCTNCQQFGHTRNYCKRRPICVRCSGNHDITECDRLKTSVKCSGCGGDHVASYRQCPARMQLLANRGTKVTARRDSVQPKAKNPPSSPLLADFPPLPRHQKPIPGFKQPLPSINPSCNPFSTSGFTELLSKFVQQFTSILIKQIEATFKSMCSTFMPQI